jgi:hypothetical protein
MGLVVVQGIAVGAAYKGLKPVVEFMTWNFCMQVGLGSGADVAESRCGRCGGAAVLLFDVARLGHVPCVPLGCPQAGMHTYP